MKRPEVINYIKSKKKLDGSSFGKFQKRKYIADLNKYIDHLEVKENDFIDGVMQTLPKRLSNSAYVKAKNNGYERFMEWWDKQV
jgi:hypothetical protein